MKRCRSTCQHICHTKLAKSRLCFWYDNICSPSCHAEHQNLWQNISHQTRIKLWTYVSIYSQKKQDVDMLIFWCQSHEVGWFPQSRTRALKNYVSGMALQKKHYSILRVQRRRRHEISTRSRGQKVGRLVPEFCFDRCITAQCSLVYFDTKKNQFGGRWEQFTFLCIRFGEPTAQTHVQHRWQDEIEPQPCYKTVKVNGSTRNVPTFPTICLHIGRQDFYKYAANYTFLPCLPDFLCPPSTWLLVSSSKIFRSMRLTDVCETILGQSEKSLTAKSSGSASVVFLTSAVM
jgi:hypothetical protein